MSKTPTDTVSEIDNINLEHLGAINKADVMEDVSRLAGTYGRISALLLLAVDHYCGAKAVMEHLEAQLDLQIRKSAEISGEKMTEKKVKSAIESTKAWEQARVTVDKAEQRMERCKSALKTLDKKDRMLELLARFQIKEYGVNSRTQ